MAKLEKKIVLVTEMVFYSLLYIDFECIDDVNCNLHGTCNKETGQCVCDIGWDSELDCSGTHLQVKNLSCCRVLEPSCCKKRQKNSQLRNWFGELGTSESSE